MMIQQNTPPNLLISVIQEKSHSFDGGISNKIHASAQADLIFRFSV